MKEETINVVQSSWKEIDKVAPQALALFYKNLSEYDPSLSRLFKGDMQIQGRKLMHTIGITVEKLNDLNSHVPVLQSLEKRHTQYGMKDAHYEVVGAASVRRLEQGLGRNFTASVIAFKPKLAD